MKIVLEDKDVENINRFKGKSEQKDSHMPLINNSDNLSISFDVLDAAKAQNFLLDIVLTNDNKKVKEIEETIGIRFTSLNFEENIKINKVKELLNRALKEIESI